MEAQEESRTFIEGHGMQHPKIRHREETTLGEVEMGGVEAKDQRWTQWRGRDERKMARASLSEASDGREKAGQRS